MSTHSGFARPTWLNILLSASVLLAMTVSVSAAPEGGDAPSAEQRISKTMHIKSGGRANREKGVTTVDAFAGIEKSGPRLKPSSQGKAQSGLAQAGDSSFDFWIYDADVVLFADDDKDGHYYGIDLLIDADTIYSAADVYAAVYLSLEGGPWNEYAVTEDFTIFGASGDDEYILITELMSGYPRGSYDLLVELFDALDGSYVASFGPEDSSGLAFLPLEDFNRDAPGFDVPIAVSHGGGGALGFLMLLPLGFALIRRRLKVIR
ncbi:MAG: choice-of-anchor H family protein [Gammaproteobacteria bacterium]|nr:choice-of-anchor H family protein [Gammaproteobacteria bacterium]MDH4316040.1 choice-of-anchor H family protein [Gammaproteobacteria bacterium]MDH5215978.1 choice-of-anchor H family protein [Gammaproteobacteria bacterium]MDH5500854.1 choice-of-anchor H family protein [Gammaproteobacteria bacterium]